MSAVQEWRLGLRAYPRQKIFELAEAHTPLGATRVHVLDLSRGGAKLHFASRSPDIGATVVLNWAGRRRSGRVCWAGDRKCGICFSVPLSEDEVSELVSA